MDRRDETSFCEKFQDACPEKVSQLRQAIRKDVKETDGQIIVVWTYHKFLASFISSIKFPGEFGHMFKDRYVDIDMQDDLEKSDIINWCRTTKPVLPIRTSGDGNCLLHAISQGLWGIEDSELFLRRLLYINLVTDPRGNFKKRWMFHQRNSSDLHRVDVRLNTVEYSEEWDSVIKATDDLGRSQSHGLPHTALESIHLFGSANILRRPIIVLADTMARNVFGETIQDSQISGIYLPLEWPPEQCDKNPLVIGYNMNHFAPLFFEDSESDRNDATLRAIPLVTKEMDSIPARFLLPNEETNYSNILRDYVKTTEVYFGTTSIPAAKVTLVPLPNSVNIVNACRKDCERKYRNLLDLNPEATVPPFNFQVGNRAEPAQHRQPERTKDPKRKQCATIGCSHFANPETQNLCSKCFKDFTIQYARQEEAARKIAKRPVLPAQPLPIRQAPMPARQHSRRDNFHDLSMMAENCQAGCGFKCSTETYPYCHECYPKYVGTGTVAQQPQQIEPQTQPMQQELSMMPQTCQNPSCSYRCSKATYPYCHGCYTQFIDTTHAAATAPPPSVPMVTGLDQRPVPSSDETALLSNRRLHQQGNQLPVNMEVTQNIEPMRLTEPMDVGSGELNKKCKSVNCPNRVVRGNNGFCDTCYQVTVFGGGNPLQNTLTSGPAVPKCSTPGCNEVISAGTEKCISCFLNGDSSQCKSLTGSRLNAVGMNITPTVEPKILNSNAPANVRLNDQTRVFSLSGSSMRSTPAEHDETAAQGPVYAPVATALQAEQEQKYQDEEQSKRICSKPGCEGLRANIEQGLCFNCLSNAGTEIAGLQPPSGSNLESSAAFSSCSPIVLSKKEMKELNPVVVSSRDKVKCASPSCDTLIYPPKKLCDTCSAVLQKFQAEKAKEENRRTVGITGAQCNTIGCTFFGSPQLKGFCSSCYKAQVPEKRYTAPLASKPSHSTNTAPLLIKSENLPVPFVVPSKAKLCIEKDCSRFGDPNQLDRCSYHYEQATAKYPPMSPESIEQNRQIIAQQQRQYPQQPTAGIRQSVREQIEASGYHHHRTQRQEMGPPRINDISQIVPGASGAQQVTNGHDEQFEQSYSKLMSSKKSNLCKNSSRGCQNYGNSSKGGYCNPCYSQRITFAT